MIDPKGLRNFRPERRRSNEPDATEGREIAHAISEGEARRSLAMTRKVELKIGDRVPMPPKPAPRPAFTGSGKPSFKPARKK